MYSNYYKPYTPSAKDCPRGLVYTDCASPCPRTCQSLHNVMPDMCTAECVSGCQCPPGKFIQDGKCVEPTQCQCEYNRVKFDHDEEVQIGCNKW